MDIIQTIKEKVTSVFDELSEMLSPEPKAGKSSPKATTSVTESEFNNALTRAKSGDSDAAYLVGKCYFAGSPIGQDYVKGFKYSLSSAKEGNASAAFNVALCYMKGLGVAPDKKEAERWLKISSSEGNVKATKALKQYFSK